MQVDTNNKALYIGVTSNLIKRIWGHKSKVVPGFTSKYNVYKLVTRKNSNWYDLYYEVTDQCLGTGMTLQVALKYNVRAVVE